MGLAIFLDRVFFFVFWCIINKYEWNFEFGVMSYFRRCEIVEIFCCLYFLGCTLAL